VPKRPGATGSTETRSTEPSIEKVPPAAEPVTTVTTGSVVVGGDAPCEPSVAEPSPQAANGAGDYADRAEETDGAQTGARRPSRRSLVVSRRVAANP